VLTYIVILNRVPEDVKKEFIFLNPILDNKLKEKEKL